MNSENLLQLVTKFVTFTADRFNNLYSFFFMNAIVQARLIRFLQEEMGIPSADVATAQRLLDRHSPSQADQNPSLLPIILWQYGLVTIDQLNCLFDWLETAQIFTGQ